MSRGFSTADSVLRSAPVWSHPQASTHCSLPTRLGAKPFICHRSAKSAANLFPCHTSENAPLQPLCLPHLRYPPGPSLFDFQRSTFRPLRIPVFSITCALFCTLFCTLEIHNSFPFNRSRTLCTKHRGVGVHSHQSPELIQRESSPPSTFNLRLSNLFQRILASFYGSRATGHDPRISNFAFRVSISRPPPKSLVALCVPQL